MPFTFLRVVEVTQMLSGTRGLGSGMSEPQLRELVVSIKANLSQMTASGPPRQADY